MTHARTHTPHTHTLTLTLIKYNISLCSIDVLVTLYGPQNILVCVRLDAHVEKESTLEEVQKRVRAAIAKKEQVVEELRAQYSLAVKRADHLEALLEQQRTQVLARK